jgi:hypothetical protein
VYAPWSDGAEQAWHLWAWHLWAGHLWAWHLSAWHLSAWHLSAWHLSAWHLSHLPERMALDLSPSLCDPIG